MLVSALTITSFADGTPAQNEKEIYAFLTNTLGLNTAAACGIMANIYHETGFRADITAGTYYGLFMYYAPLVRELKNWCAANGQDHTTVAGQMAFFKVLLEGGIQYYNYDSMMSQLRALPNTAEGAYSAGDIFCRQFERPASLSYQANLRGTYASGTLFPKYFGTTVSGDTATVPETAVSYTAYVTASSLNVRTGPSTYNGVSGGLVRGQSVSIVAETNDGKWCKLSSGGWVSKEYLSTSAPATEPESVEASGTYYVSASALNVRSNAGTSYQIIDCLLRGEAVTVTNEATVGGTTWCKLSTGGWVSKAYLSTSPASDNANDSADTEDSKSYTVAASGLNVRAGAGTNYDVIDCLFAGEKANVVSEATGSDGNIWCKLSSGGWVSKEYLTDGTDTGISGGTTYTVNAACLLVRSGAGTSYGVVSRLWKSMEVTVVATEFDVLGNVWGQLSSGGWISMDYVS